MPATQPSKELRVFCHEHHVKMRLNQRILNSKGDAKHSLAYAGSPIVSSTTTSLADTSCCAKTETRMSWTWFPESDVPTMGRPCISLKSILRKGGFGCGYARNAMGDARMRRAS
jgi:hypothetical protein